MELWHYQKSVWHSVSHKGVNNNNNNICISRVHDYIRYGPTYDAIIRSVSNHAASGSASVACGASSPIRSPTSEKFVTRLFVVGLCVADGCMRAPVSYCKIMISETLKRHVADAGLSFRVSSPESETLGNWWENLKHKDESEQKVIWISYITRTREHTHAHKHTRARIYYYVVLKINRAYIYLLLLRIFVW